jgi:hypothetical protein
MNVEVALRYIEACSELGRHCDPQADGGCRGRGDFTHAAPAVDSLWRYDRRRRTHDARVRPKAGLRPDWLAE